MALPPLDPQPTQLALEKPVLLVVVDTEEEFQWDQPFNREATGTQSIPAQDRAHAIFEKYGVIPTYVVDYPVATSPKAAKYLRRLVDSGQAHAGTHCHPWVTPPFDEVVSTYNSFHGNLPPDLEMAKVRSSTEAVADAFGQAPRIFKAGRYGVGQNTFHVIKELGYSIDCSFVPATSFSHDQGPNFHGTPCHPFFTDRSGQLLEVPLSVGYGGQFASIGQDFPSLWDSAWAQRARVPGLLSRLGLLWRARLSPEGFDSVTQIRLINAMLKQGVKVFTLTYHSPSLAPGFTPYVKNDSDLDEFLRRLNVVLMYFRDQVGGEFSTLNGIRDRASSIRSNHE